MIGRVFILLFVGSAFFWEGHTETLAETSESERGIRDGIQQTVAGLYGNAKEIVSDLVDKGKAKLREEYEELKLRTQEAIEEQKRILKERLEEIQQLASRFGAEKFEEEKKKLELATKHKVMQLQAKLDSFGIRHGDAPEEDQSEGTSA